MAPRSPPVKHEPWLTPSMTPFRAPSMRGIRLPRRDCIQALNRGDPTVSRARTPCNPRRPTSFSCPATSEVTAGSDFNSLGGKFGWQAFEAPGSGPFSGPQQTAHSWPSTQSAAQRSAQEGQTTWRKQHAQAERSCEFIKAVASAHEREMLKIRAQAQQRLEELRSSDDPVPATVPPFVARQCELVRPGSSLDHPEPYRGCRKLPRGYSPELKYFGIRDQLAPAQSKRPSENGRRFKNIPSLKMMQATSRPTTSNF